jgi:hypothetical protein
MTDVTDQYSPSHHSPRRICRQGKKVWLQKQPMDLCASESEDHEHGVGAGVNATLLSETL